MKFSKTIKLCVTGCAAALAFSACSDSSSSSKAENNPQNTEVALSACGTIDDATLNARLAQAEIWAMDALESGAKTQFEAMQTEIDSAYTIFSEIIRLYPNSCEAQFGLALTLLANAANNPFVDSVYHILNSGTESERYGLINIDIKGYSNAAFKAAAMAKSNSQAGLITERAQSAIAGSFLPKTDSALALLKNVRNAGNFSYTILDGDNDTWELDAGDLDMAIGGVEAVNAFLTVLASFELDASKDNSYNWLLRVDSAHNTHVYMDSLSAEEIAAVSHALSLFDKDSPFLTVKSAWKSAYAAVPATLDSAVQNVKSGLEFKIATAGQNPNAIYIVGNGEDADISPSDLQKAVDVCDSLLKGIRGTVNIRIYGEDVALNASKFFAITDGFQDYLPYFQFTDPSTWLDLPASGYGWTSDWVEARQNDSTVLASLEIAKQFKSILSDPLEDLDLYYYKSYSTSEFYLSVEYETEDDWGDIETFLVGWNYRFETDENAGTDSTVTFALSEEFCQTGNGLTLYKTLPEYTLTADILYFTDANGNKTVSFAELRKIIHEEGNTAEFFAQNIIFPDPTFGGIFPNMTQEQLGRFLSKETN